MCGYGVSVVHPHFTTLNIRTSADPHIRILPVALIPSAGASQDSQPFRSRANSLPGANRPLGPWPIRSLGLSFLGPFAPWLFRSLAFSLPGTFAPRSEMAWEL